MLYGEKLGKTCRKKEREELQAQGLLCVLLKGRSTEEVHVLRKRKRFFKCYKSNER